jgi:prevent-host-death family protein
MKRKTFKYPAVGAAPLRLREATVAGEPPLILNVRAAKDQLSSLLEAAARGDEVIITSDGQPKARLGPVRPTRRPFQVDWELLRSRPAPSGKAPAEEIVRTDRDARD